MELSRLTSRSLTGIRWTRVILAAVLSEAGVIAVLLAIIAIYRSLIAPGMSDAEYQALGSRVGYYVAPIAGMATTFLMVLWVGRKLDSRYVAHGVWVGVVSVILTLGFIFTARPEDRVMYGVAFVLRIAAGYLGGLVAQQCGARVWRRTETSEAPRGPGATTENTGSL
jgi:hypothetical protein